MINLGKYTWILFVKMNSLSTSVPTCVRICLCLSCLMYQSSHHIIDITLLHIFIFKAMNPLQRVIIYITQYFSSKCSTPSQLLLCSSSSMENGHLEKLIQSRSTPLKYMFTTILQKSSYLPTQAKHYYKGIPSILANLGFV